MSAIARQRFGDGPGSIRLLELLQSKDRVPARIPITSSLPIGTMPFCPPRPAPRISALRPRRLSSRPRPGRTAGASSSGRRRSPSGRPSRPAQFRRLRRCGAGSRDLGEAVAEGAPCRPAGSRGSTGRAIVRLPEPQIALDQTVAVAKAVSIPRRDRGPDPPSTQAPWLALGPLPDHELAKIVVSTEVPGSLASTRPPEVRQRRQRRRIAAITVGRQLVRLDVRADVDRIRKVARIGDQVDLVLEAVGAEVFADRSPDFFRKSAIDSLPDDRTSGEAEDVGFRDTAQPDVLVRDSLRQGRVGIDDHQRHLRAAPAWPEWHASRPSSKRRQNPEPSETRRYSHKIVHPSAKSAIPVGAPSGAIPR